MPKCGSSASRRPSSPRPSPTERDYREETGAVVDGPAGIVSTCAHSILRMATPTPFGVTYPSLTVGKGLQDPFTHGVAIGVSFDGETIEWKGAGHVVRVSFPMPLPFEKRTIHGVTTVFRWAPPAHWTWHIDPGSLDLAVLKVVQWEGSTFTDTTFPGTVGSVPRAFTLRDTPLECGEPLVVVGHGQSFMQATGVTTVRAESSRVLSPGGRQLITRGTGARPIPCFSPATAAVRCSTAAGVWSAGL